jgi:hypothetical protein
MTAFLLDAEQDRELPCVRCRAKAAGPCASCRELVCGDCCVLVEGGVRVWAICLDCDQPNGATTTLSGGWRELALWLVWIFIGLALVTWVLARVVG